MINLLTSSCLGLDWYSIEYQDCDI